jgi:hypothetical protein
MVHISFWCDDDDDDDVNLLGENKHYKVLNMIFVVGHKGPKTSAGPEW